MTPMMNANSQMQKQVRHTTRKALDIAHLFKIDQSCASMMIVDKPPNTITIHTNKPVYQKSASSMSTPPESLMLALLWHFRLGDICKEHVTVRTLSGWRSCEEVEDRLPDGRHAWLWWRS